MKKLIFAVLLCMAMTACHVRHYGGKQLQVRVARPQKEYDPLQAMADEGDTTLFSLPGDLMEDEDSTGESLLDGMSDEYDEDVEMVDEEALEDLERMVQGLPEKRR
jgi:DNA-directed RNA polymerase specialized sigma24 family protein